MDRVDVIAEVSEKAFNAENDRRDKITEKAEKYIAAVALIVGFKVFESDPLAMAGGARQATTAWLTVLTFIALGVALAFVLLSMRVRNYRTYAPGSELLDKIMGTDVTCETARIMVARMYLDAQEANSKINNQRAWKLAIGGFLLLAGFVLAVLSELSWRLTM